MLKRILIAIGLAKAPTPIKSYVMASSFIGTVPALLWVAWRNRDRIRALAHDLRARSAQPA
jgi:hypothetical protein